METKKDSIQLEEYKELSANMRMYGNLRFAQLTIFFAVNGGLVAVLFARLTPLTSLPRITLGIVGFLVTGVFWIAEIRAADYWNAFLKRALALERELGFLVYTERPDSQRFFSATNSVRVMFWVFLGCWFLVIILFFFAPDWIYYSRICVESI